MIDEKSALWQYMSPQQRVLTGDGEFLLEDSTRHINEEPTDYSYLVFPFAKLYEGFLKQLFLDVGIITARDYRSDHLRIGKVLSPNLVRRLGPNSAYGQIRARFGEALADRLWNTWKTGRNLVFHYFPHNYRALTRAQAQELISSIVATMEEAVAATRVQPHRQEE